MIYSASQMRLKIPVRLVLKYVERKVVVCLLQFSSAAESFSAMAIVVNVFLWHVLNVVQLEHYVPQNNDSD